MSPENMEEKVIVNNPLVALLITIYDSISPNIKILSTTSIN